MHIKQIHIDQYGMFSDVTFDLLSPGMQVLYGVNEAGKSTLMRFIQEILFGFSSRSPGISDGGVVYGGRLTLDVSGSGMGIVTVERKGNKGKGTVKLYFDDGRTAGEEKLDELLQGLDASMFRAIFSFGLEGLQGLENIKADELNDYLFHAGMTGDFSIRELEKKLGKKQDALFKPNGRKPLLNQQLVELESQEKEMNEWKKKIGGYRQLHEESEMIRQRMKTITMTKENHRKEIRSLERQKTLVPYIEEERELQLRLNQLPVYEPFPEDGLSRFENRNTKKIELEGQLAELQTKRQVSVEKLNRKKELEEQLIRERLKNKRLNTTFYGGLSLAVILAVWFILYGHWVSGIVAAAMLFAFSFYLRKNMGQADSGMLDKDLSEIQNIMSHTDSPVSMEEIDQVKLIFDEQIQSLQNKICRYQNECHSLMKQAETEDEEAYRRKGKAWQESRDILEKLTSVRAKIEALVPDEFQREAFIAAISEREVNEDAEISRFENEIKQLEGEERELHGKLADLTAEKNQLEEGGTYSELFHRFEQNKDRFRWEARKWAVYHTAEDLLEKAKERYRNERLPKVIEEASQYFATMTAGRYPVLFAPRDEGFIVERTDGKRFSPRQLSRGTAEQLYLSIRLALARIYQSPSPYPLIMDDILVNFDAKRVEKAIDAIRQTAENHQVLLFTCHHHLFQQFHDQEILSIEQGRDTALPM